MAEAATSATCQKKWFTQHARSWARFARRRLLVTGRCTAAQRQHAGGACDAVAWRPGRRRLRAVGQRRPARASAAAVAAAPRLRTHTADLVRQRGCSRRAAVPRSCVWRSSRGGLQRGPSARRAPPRRRRARVRLAACRRVRDTHWIRQRQRERRRKERERRRHLDESAPGAPQARRTAQRVRVLPLELHAPVRCVARCVSSPRRRRLRKKRGISTL